MRCPCRVGLGARVRVRPCKAGSARTLFGMRCGGGLPRSLPQQQHKRLSPSKPAKWGNREVRGGFGHEWWLPGPLLGGDDVFVLECGFDFGDALDALVVARLDVVVGHRQVIRLPHRRTAQRSNLPRLRPSSTEGFARGMLCMLCMRVTECGQDLRGGIEMFFDFGNALRPRRDIRDRIAPELNLGGASRHRCGRYVWGWSCVVMQIVTFSTGLVRLR